jgi:hypothetical protein
MARRRQPIHVVGRHRLAHAGQVDQTLHHGCRALDLVGGAAQGHRVPAERDADPEGPLELEQVGIVHAREQQRVRPFGGQAVLMVVGHGYSPAGLRCSARRS